MFDYQLELASKMLGICSRKTRFNEALLALPTGAGKTRTAVYAVLEAISSGHATRTLWLAPSHELLEQAIVTVRALWKCYHTVPSIELVRWRLLKKIPIFKKPVVFFATPQLLVQRFGQKRRRASPSFDLVVFDEAHQAVAPEFQHAVDTVRSQDGRASPLVGLSATPGRADPASTEALVDLFGGRLLTSERLRPNPIQELQQRGILARLEFKSVTPTRKFIGQHQIATSVNDLPKSTKQWEYDLGRFSSVIELVQTTLHDRQTLVFAGSIAHANALYVALVGKGCRVEVISSQTPTRERDRILDAFGRGDINVLINKSILTTGYDAPAVTDVVLTMPIRSPILFEQIVGRASRGPEVGGNAVSCVWQLDDHLEIHGLPRSYYRYRDFDWAQ